MATPIRTGKRGRPRTELWNCQCDCGAMVAVRAAHLVSGNTKSCGCNQLLPSGEAARNSLYAIYRAGAKNRKLAFALSVEQFTAITQQDCHYCGQAPAQTHQPPDCSTAYSYNGIDRKDNTRGYEPDNCLPCCGLCNRMKSALSYGDFMDWIGRVINHWK